MPPAAWSALRTASLASAFAVAAPSPTRAITLVTAGPEASGSASQPLLGALALLGWLLLGWSALVLALLLAEHLPGLAGATAHWVAGRVAPAPIRRSLALAVGLSLATGAAPAAAATRPPSRVVSSVVAIATDPGLSSRGGPALAPRSSGSLDWPVPTSTAAGSLDWPVPTSRAAGSLDWPVPTSSAAGSLDWPAPQAPEATTPGQVMAPTVHVVRPGESLWTIAAERLPVDAPPAVIAASWPSWWTANREAVGPDPDLLLPGTRLVPPTTAPAHPNPVLSGSTRTAPEE